MPLRQPLTTETTPHGGQHPEPQADAIAKASGAENNQWSFWPRYNRKQADLAGISRH
jgi:hypothetical protein